MKTTQIIYQRKESAVVTFTVMTVKNSFEVKDTRIIKNITKGLYN